MKYGWKRKQTNLQAPFDSRTSTCRIYKRRLAKTITFAHLG